MKPIYGRDHMDKNWAFKLQERELRGEKISLFSQRAWREVLAKLGDYIDPVKHNPTIKEDKKIKRYTLS